MARNLLPIRILFHATLAFVYVPIIVLGFTWGLSLDATLGITGIPFVLNHIDGIVALTGLAGLGILAVLDILIILRKVNQRAFLIIEVIVVVLMPLSMWPIILAALSVIWPAQLQFVNEYLVIGLPIFQDTFTSASVIAATFAIFGLNTAFIPYICITAITDKVRGNTFLPGYPEESSLSSIVPRERWRLFGTRRAPAERAEVVRHCADYIFRHSVFRKHAFEPTAWAILRGILAVYSCIGLVVFSAYSGYTEFQLYTSRAYTVNDAILAHRQCADLFADFEGISVSATTMMDNNFTITLSPGTDYVPQGSGTWYNIDYNYFEPPQGFEISWIGNDSLAMWATMADSTGFMNSTQVDLTSPLILAPFKQYNISLSMMKYTLGSLEFISFRPDVITSVDSASGSNSSATFQFNSLCHAMIQRALSAPSFFSEAAHVLSTVGGTMAFIDGIFALIFGRTIVAILVGTRIVSPFGLLGVVTHNRFKRLIHEQYPHMQQDIDRGGMAAYISEVAIDAALINKPSTTEHTTSVTRSRIGDMEEGGENIELGLRETGSSASYLGLSSHGEELGDLENIPLVDSQTDHK